MDSPNFRATYSPPDSNEPLRLEQMVSGRNKITLRTITFEEMRRSPCPDFDNVSLHTAQVNINFYIRPNWVFGKLFTRDMAIELLQFTELKISVARKMRMLVFKDSVILHAIHKRLHYHDDVFSRILFKRLWTDHFLSEIWERYSIVREQEALLLRLYIDQFST